MVSIHDRPTDVIDRRVPGHWEGDLVMGRRPSAVASLVERTSRLVRLVALPEGIKAVPVRQAVVASLAEIDPELRRTLTWDRGREMADHSCLTEQTGCAVYFCDPKSPWQRGANENMNRLLRQYLDKYGDLRVHDQAASTASPQSSTAGPARSSDGEHPPRYATLAANMTMAP